ncbi:MAG: hypothetical protein ACXAEU_16550 [Candidatus Hodarchaeales archaeon]|jgi:hypothetical protein
MDEKNTTDLLNDRNNLDEVIKQRLRNHFKVETRYSIVTALRMYGPLNIKLLSKILGKTESTVFHHITSFLTETEKPRIIEIDQEKTETSRGKYYKLSEEVQNHYEKVSFSKAIDNEIPDLFEKWNNIPDSDITGIMIEQLKNRSNLGDIAESTRRALSYHHTIENFILNNFSATEKAIKEGHVPVKEKGIPFGAYSLLSIAVDVFSPKHMLRIAKVVTDFMGEMYRIKDEIKKEIDEQEIDPEDIVTEHYYIFGGTINEFKFKKKE